MSIQIDAGLFSSEFIDHHAILGVPVDAEFKDVRKQYLKLARRLHPDSCAKDNESDRQRAAEYLSKLVNPAYEYLSNEKNFTEYLVLLKLKGQQAARQQDTIVLTSDAAGRLAGATGDLEVPYRAAVKELAEKQYQHLDKTPSITGAISELNLIYLMRKGNAKVPPMPPPGPPHSGLRPPAPPKPTEVKETLVDASIRRARECEAKNDLAGALKELREAVKIYPNHSGVHTALAGVYLKANQATMTKIHARKALELDAQNSTAKELLRRVDPTAAGAASQSPGSKPDPKTSKTAPKDSKPSGGMFGSLFGKKK